MEALELLSGRVSVAGLCEPAPTPEQLDIMFRAALRAPDHALLRPWRFLTIAGEGRERLGELFARALARDPQVQPAALDKARKTPLRAPLLIVVIASPKPHPKVPEIEQLLAAGCAAHGLLLAAHAQGIGAIWRTGEFAYDSFVARGLGLEAHERIIGFIYAGTPEVGLRTAPALERANFVGAWPQ
ncbi:nitroreductase family protein [Azomonas macrocytogenes]|uniref:Putative NAD(P)H nitroreductase n=1 Tax=Azomonas macrocytogenes TaxID=69962 RepID=A0A839T3N6_AZOMA|nr:nitroreductase family protein [Azomonas macrocytogenes]MBB3103619.1 nitroreductase [Azomonas macrocytogenes]